MSDNFYRVTADQVRAYHERCAERAEEQAEEQQAKLEKIPVEARDACNQGMLGRYRREGEEHRALANGVGDVASGFMVDHHEYLRIIGGDDYSFSRGGGPTVGAQSL